MRVIKAIIGIWRGARGLKRRFDIASAWGTVELLSYREVQLNGVTGAYRYRYLEHWPDGEHRSPWHPGPPPGWEPREAILAMKDSLMESWAETEEQARQIREDAEARRTRLQAAIDGPGARFSLDPDPETEAMARRLAPLPVDDEDRPSFVGIDRGSGPDCTRYAIYGPGGKVLWRDGEPMPEDLRQRILSNLTDHSKPFPLGYYAPMIGPRDWI